MKVTLLQQNNITQLVLTPETPWEEKALNAIPENQDYEIKRGNFFDECRGGYMRQYADDKSLMFVMKPKQVPSHK